MTDGAARGLVFVLSGPSGVGKDAVLAKLSRRGFRLGRVTTAVTREPRPGEVHGVDYYFLSRDEFARLVDGGEFLEWADYVGSPRGTPIFGLRETLSRGEDAILKIDVDGFRQVRARFPNTISIFLVPPSMETLEQHLVERGDVPASEITRRLERARAELAAAAEYDYRVVNYEGRLDRTVDEIAAIITAERERTPPRSVTL